MPNWCSNHLQISGNKEVIEKIKKGIHNNNGLFELFYPVPEELDYTVGHPPNKTDEQIAELVKKYGAVHWYDWSINNWGCKWDACEIYIEESNDVFLHLCFDTPWSPPIGFYTKLANDYKVDICATYSEEGMSFCGKWQSTVKDNEVFIRKDDHAIDKTQGDILSRYLVINKNIEVTPDDFLDKVRCLYRKIYPEVCDYYDAEEMFGEWWLENRLEDEEFCKQYGIINVKETMNEELKEYTCNIVLDFGRSYMAKSKEEFVDMVLSDFYEEHGYKLDESELKNIQEVK